MAEDAHPEDHSKDQGIRRLTRFVREPAIHFRFFSSASDAVRARRPTDAILLFVAVIAIALASVVPDTSPLVAAITDLVQALPGLLGWFWESCDILVVLWALVLVGSALVGRARLALLRDQISAIVVASVAGAVLLKGDASFLDAVTVGAPPPIDPAIRLALAVAVIATTGPHLGRPVRRVGRWLIPLAAVAGLALGLTSLLGMIVGLSLGYGAAALVHLAVGSPGGRPTPDEVEEALADLGIEVADVQEAALAARGVALMDVATFDGRRLLVKYYGRDAWDGQLLNTTWSYLWYRDDTPSITLSRLQQVEHEAFLTLLAERAGVPVEPVVAAGMAEEDAVLVLQLDGMWLDEVDDDAVTDDLVRGLWDALVRLHDAGIVHGAVDGRHLAILPAGTGVFAGFGGASAAPSDAQTQADRAQLLVTTATRVGDARAVDAAAASLGQQGLGGVLPYIQPAALTHAMRRSSKRAGTDLDDLRERAAAAAGTEPPELEPLRRVTWGSLLVVALLLFGAAAIFVALSNVGLDTLVSEFENADSTWVWVALVVSLLAQPAEAFSTLGACPRPLPLGPVIGLQYAIRFIALAVPSSAARVALNVRFFQKAGLATAPAIAVGLVDSVAGFVVQVFLLLTIWIAGLSTLTLSTQGLSIDVDSQMVIGIVILVVVLVAVAVLVPRVRRVIGPRLAEAGEALRVVRSPTKVAELFGGNLLAQLILAMVLGASLRAFGQHLSLADLILVNTLASLLAGILPIPGGIGVTEAAIAYGLVAGGVPESTAVAAAILYRVVTFYLPPIWGAYAMRVLRQRGYI
jgi:uncharacterized membrane protein YbhN (UPF0104 family)